MNTDYYVVERADLLATLLTINKKLRPSSRKRNNAWNCAVKQRTRTSANMSQEEIDVMPDTDDVVPT